MSNLIRQNSPVVNTVLAKIISLQDHRIVVELIDNTTSSLCTILKLNILSNGFTYEDEYLQPGQILKLYHSQHDRVKGELRDLTIYPGQIISISADKFNIEFNMNDIPTKLSGIPINRLRSTEPITVGTPIKVYVNAERVVGFAVVKVSIYGNLVSSTVNSAPHNYILASAPEISERHLDRMEVTERSVTKTNGELYDDLLHFSGKLQKQHLKLLKLIKKSIQNNGVLDIPSLTSYLSKTPDLSNYPELSSSRISRSFIRKNKKIVETTHKIKNSSVSLRICQICNKPSREFELGCRHFICGEDLRSYLSEKVELKVSDWDYSYSIYAPCRLCSYNLSELELKTIMNLDVSSLVAEQVENIKREALKRNQIFMTGTGLPMYQCSRCMQYKQIDAYNYNKECNCILCKECFISSNSSHMCILCSYRSTQVLPISTSSNPNITQQSGIKWPSSFLPGSQQALSHQKGEYTN